MNLEEFAQGADRTFSYSQNGLTPDQTNLLHCVVGIRTEVDELEEAFEKFDLVNAREEAGDVLYYIAVWLLLSGKLDDVDHDPLMLMSMNGVTGWVKYIKKRSSNLLDNAKKQHFTNSQKEFDNFKEMQNLYMGVLGLCSVGLGGLDWSPGHIMSTIIAKLKARYPEKFTAENCDNRDLEKERQILEQ